MSKKDTVKNELVPQEKQEKVTIIDSGISAFGKLINLVKNNSLWVLLKTLVVSAFFGLLIFIITNPTFIFEKYKEYEERRHSMELSQRFNKMEILNRELSETLMELHADRAFFIEYHNSVKSLQGAPFAYGSMSFEKIHPNREIVFMADEYSDFPLTKYETVTYLYENKVFIGTIDDLMNIDKRLATKLKASNVTQVALIEVWGDNQPLGILGVTWSEHEVIDTYGDKIRDAIYQHSNKIRNILN
jgi:hypothetical protein